MISCKRIIFSSLRPFPMFRCLCKLCCESAVKPFAVQSVHHFEKVGHFEIGP